jgi:predicted CoA-binding protein
MSWRERRPNVPSNYETFWTHQRYAVIGDSRKATFPKLTYNGLKANGKTPYAVDPGAERIEGDAAYASLDALPETVDAAVLEVPKTETADWVERVADAGIKNLWIHQQRDTPEALEIAKQRGINVLHSTCAVMYLQGGYHSIHKWINKLIGKY